jgi:1,4-alpha-glucan branching enzyme
MPSQRIPNDRGLGYAAHCDQLVERVVERGANAYPKIDRIAEIGLTHIQLLP